jgi:hypothetical protein
MAGITLEEREGSVQLQCLPLYSILLALGNPTVNYFSLDIEGAEFPVLQTIPWDKVDIQVQILRVKIEKMQTGAGLWQGKYSERQGNPG